MLKVLSRFSWPMTLGQLRLNLFDYAVLMPLVTSILGVLLARAVVMGQLYPFGLSYLAGICLGKPEWKKYALLGVLAGTIVTVPGLPLLGYLASIAILYSVFVCYNKESLHWLLVPTLIFGIHLLCRGSIVFFTGGEPYLWVAILFECIFIGILSMVVHTGIHACEKLKSGGIILPEERTSLGLVVLGILAGLTGFSLFGCSLQSVVSRWLVLWGAFLGGPGGGAAVGAAVGLAPSIQGTVTLGPVAFYALAGLLGGIFCSFRKSGVIIGFALANLLLSFFFTEDLEIITSLKETGLAVLLFLIMNIPFSLQTRIAKQQMAATNNAAVAVNLYYAERLDKIAALFYELEKVFDYTPESQPEKENLKELFDKATSQVCNGCSLKRICWEQDFYKTYQAFLEVSEKLAGGVVVAEKDFGMELKRRCMRLRELSVALNAQYEGFKLVRKYEKRLEVCHGLVNRQLIGLARMIEDFAGEIKKEIKEDESTEELIRSKMAEKGFSFAAVRVLELPQGEKEIQIMQKPCEKENWCSAMIAPNLSQIMDRTYLVKNKHCGELTGYLGGAGAGGAGYGCCAFSLVPSRTLAVTVGQAQCPKEGIPVSGDLCSALTLPHHQFALIMCDGMGVGADAYAESSAAVNMLEKLLLAGFSPQVAIRTVNTVLLLKTPLERFVALDLVVVDQITGQCDFIKIGGVPSLLCTENGLKVVKSSSPPVGILEEVQPQIFRHMLKPQNRIIMMSDGIWDSLDKVDGPEGWLEDLLAQVDSSDPQTIADSLLYIAKKAAGNQALDDMCVLVACFEQNNIT
jgi:stage II sporulation protein E